MLNRLKWSILFLLVFFSTFPLQAYAYIGPGLGAGTLGVLIGLIASVFVALFAIIWYPIKRLLKKVRCPPEKP